MRELGISCGIGGWPSYLYDKIEQTFEFSQKFKTIFNEKFSYKKYGSSLEYISFGTTYISANSSRKEEIMFNLDCKEFIYSIVLTEKQLVECSIDQLIEMLISSIETGISYMKSLDVGEYNVISMELDIKEVLRLMGYKYVSIDRSQKLIQKAKFVINRNKDELDIFEQSDFFIQLFKMVRGKLRFWETWETKSGTALVHTGTIGKKGHLKQVKSTSKLKYKEIIKEEIDKVIKEGYRLLDEDELKYIKIESQVFDTAKKENRKLQLEKIVNENLGWTGLGCVEYSGIGRNKIVLICRVINIELATKILEKLLKKYEDIDYSITIDKTTCNKVQIVHTP